ncbi:DUF4435 domain-containing protein [Niallia sp. Sow4_A1]|uniref:DUF4435 domain-containing protein n=1 Tax=unclassified Niallia TaxID=2837522 RepID=UPI002041139D|nr:DUF4435 domain-containing protein [Niallia sp. MER TA 168]MCM3364220.1 DUF4435 domain-containing protein [Niallia sp. MER TA 168]
MFEHMTPERTANAIMQDTTFNGTYLIVEGMKDFNLYNKFINVGDTVEIKQVGGKEKVIEVIKILEERQFEEKIGIVDTDFSKISERDLLIASVFSTDYHDSEVMMFKSPALETLLYIYVKKDKLEEFLNGRDLRATLLNIAKEIGLLKLANYLHSFGLAFKPKNIDGNTLKYKNFIDERTLQFKGKEELINTVYNYSLSRSSQVADKELVHEKFDELSNKEYDFLQLVNGHDLSNIIFLLLKKALRSTKKSLSDYNTIEDSFIMSYEARYFIETELFQNLYKWSNLNDVNLFKEDIKELYQKMNLIEV